ncbi:UNKNOWN [Stylonychia lemnae]|uniref:Uncharacterized protein n=1 Tax=Stylonychia lemnae TaxID=5949 RepID=A0A077ZSS8_STYLE|nr:UNKNOWN [Stylonychia lemnae]|eukprot:CDW72365.1 UNKNOWN [Stylonychia lemnae]
MKRFQQIEFKLDLHSRLKDPSKNSYRVIISIKPIKPANYENSKLDEQAFRMRYRTMMKLDIQEYKAIEHHLVNNNFKVVTPSPSKLPKNKYPYILLRISNIKIFRIPAITEEVFKNSEVYKQRQKIESFKLESTHFKDWQLSLLRHMFYGYGNSAVYTSHTNSASTFSTNNKGYNIKIPIKADLLDDAQFDDLIVAYHDFHPVIIVNDEDESIKLTTQTHLEELRNHARLLFKQESNYFTLMPQKIKITCLIIKNKSFNY